MMYPILCKVQYEKLHEVFKAKEIWVQMGFSIIINWIIAPLVMVRFFYLPLFPRLGERSSG
jgi:ACR3 family arsenite transporter